MNKIIIIGCPGSGKSTFAKELKKSLEQNGLKVKLTRDEDVTLPSYGKEGRAIIPNKVRAKLLLSIHLNTKAHKTLSVN